MSRLLSAESLVLLVLVATLVPLVVVADPDPEPEPKKQTKEEKVHVKKPRDHDEATRLLLKVAHNLQDALRINVSLPVPRQAAPIDPGYPGQQRQANLEDFIDLFSDLISLIQRLHQLAARSGMQQQQ